MHVALLDYRMRLFGISSTRPLFGDNDKVFEAERPAWRFNAQVETEIVIAPKRAREDRDRRGRRRWSYRRAAMAGRTGVL